MNKKLADMVSSMDLNSSATSDIIKQTEAQLGFILPSDYVDFLLHSNGAEGEVGNSYLVLWPIDQIVELNEDYAVKEFAPGLILFGSDGGGEAFAFDTRTSPITIVNVPFIGMDLEEITQRWSAFEDFILFLFEFEFE